MKISRYAFAFAAAMILMCFTASSYGQKTGGYSEISKSDAAAVAAAKFAVTTQAERTNKHMAYFGLLKAERQVVAGSNYRLCVRVVSEGVGSESDQIIVVQAIVYVDLKGDRNLTSWMVTECGEGS